MNITTVDDQVVGNSGERGLFGVERDDVVNVLARRNAEFDANEPVVMRARIRLGHRIGIWADQFGHYRIELWGDAGAGWRKARVRRRRADDDPTRTILVG